MSDRKTNIRWKLLLLLKYTNREMLQHFCVLYGFFLVLFCSVVALDVNKIDVNYNKRISKYRDNDDKNGWWVSKRELLTSIKESVRSNACAQPTNGIYTYRSDSKRERMKGNLTMNNNRNIKIPSLSRLEQ